MQENKEIKALLHLIDDPDEDVYLTVSRHILSLGKSIIPDLEHLWEIESNEFTQERIEQLIHRLHYEDLEKDFLTWKEEKNDLLTGAILASRYHYPDVQPQQIYNEIEKLKRNIWLELNNYLTPIEKVSVLNSILYNYFKLKAAPHDDNQPDSFLINKTLENKSGNIFSNGILYLALCEMLDISVKAVNIPQQFLLAYFEEPHDPSLPLTRILFYIDPNSGQLYSSKDVDNYLKKLTSPADLEIFKPRNNTDVVATLLNELSKCFDNDNNRYKMEELLLLAEKLGL